MLVQNGNAKFKVIGQPVPIQLFPNTKKLVVGIPNILTQKAGGSGTSTTTSVSRNVQKLSSGTRKIPNSSAFPTTSKSFPNARKLKTQFRSTSNQIIASSSALPTTTTTTTTTSAFPYAQKLASGTRNIPTASTSATTTSAFPHAQILTTRNLNNHPNSSAANSSSFPTGTTATSLIANPNAQIPTTGNLNNSKNNVKRLKRSSHSVANVTSSSLPTSKLSPAAFPSLRSIRKHSLAPPMPQTPPPAPPPPPPTPPLSLIQAAATTCQPPNPQKPHPHPHPPPHSPMSLTEPPAYLNIRVKEEVPSGDKKEEEDELNRMTSVGDMDVKVKLEVKKEPMDEDADVDVGDEMGDYEDYRSESDLPLRMGDLLDVRIKEEATDEQSDLLVRDEQLRQVLGAPEAPETTTTTTSNSDDGSSSYMDHQRHQSQLFHYNQQQQNVQTPSLPKFYVRTPDGKLVLISQDEAQALGLNHNDRLEDNQRKLWDALRSSTTALTSTVNRSVGTDIAAAAREMKVAASIPNHILNQQRSQQPTQKKKKKKKQHHPTQSSPSIPKFYIRTPEGKLVVISPSEVEALGLNHNDSVEDNQRRLLDALQSSKTTVTSMVSKGVEADAEAELNFGLSKHHKLLIPENINVKEFVSCHVAPEAEKTAALMKTLASHREDTRTHNTKEPKANSSIIGEFEMEDGRRYLQITIETEAKGKDLCNVPITPIYTYECPFCTREFKTKDHVISHIRIHTGERPYPCEICGKRYRQRIDIIRHMRIHTGEKPFNCGLCDASFNQKSNLRSHMRIHTGERPVECPVCRKGFSRNTHLKQHMKLHTGEKPYKCKICQRPFRYRSGLQAHERIHTGSRPYICSHCGRTFTQVIGLLRHEKTHAGEKGHRCLSCGKSFDTLSAFKRHMAKHSKERPHICDLCPKTFTDAADLRSHRNKYHSSLLICVVCLREDFKNRIELKEHLRAHERERQATMEEETKDGDLAPLSWLPGMAADLNFTSADGASDVNKDKKRTTSESDGGSHPRNIASVNNNGNNNNNDDDDNGDSSNNNNDSDDDDDGGVVSLGNMNHIEVELDPDDPMEEDSESGTAMDEGNDRCSSMSEFQE